MKEIDSCIDLPVGDCKTTESVKSFIRDGERVYLSYKTEERSYGDVVILEEEKIRVATGKKRISIFQVNIAVEDGIEKKVVEYAMVEPKEGKTSINRHKKMTKQKQKVYDCEMQLTENMDYYNQLSENIINKFELSSGRK